MKRPDFLNGIKAFISSFNSHGEEKKEKINMPVKSETERFKPFCIDNGVDTLKKLKSGKEITEDELASFSDTVEKAVTSAIDKIDALASEKEKDVMTV